MRFLIFLQMRWNVKGGHQDFSNKVNVFNVTSVLIFQYKKMPEKEVQTILSNWSIPITTKANLRRKSLICSP